MNDATKFRLQNVGLQALVWLSLLFAIYLVRVDINRLVVVTPLSQDFLSLTVAGIMGLGVDRYFYYRSNKYFEPATTNYKIESLANTVENSLRKLQSQVLDLNLKLDELEDKITTPKQEEKKTEYSSPAPDTYVKEEVIEEDD